MPIFVNLDFKTRWIPVIFGLVTGGMWIAQCIYQLISMLIKGEIWKSVDDVIGAYLIVVGVPQAVFSTYNFVRHLWWNYYITHDGAPGYRGPEMK